MADEDRNEGSRDGKAAQAAAIIAGLRKKVQGPIDDPIRCVVTELLSASADLHPSARTDTIELAGKLAEQIAGR